MRNELKPGEPAVGATRRDAPTSVASPPPDGMPHQVPVAVPHRAPPAQRLAGAARDDELACRRDSTPGCTYSPASRVRRVGSPPVARDLPDVTAGRIVHSWRTRSSGHPATTPARPRTARSPPDVSRRGVAVRQVHDPDPPDGLEREPAPVGRGGVPAGEARVEGGIGDAARRERHLGDGALHLGGERNDRGASGRHVDASAAGRRATTTIARPSGVQA